MGIIPGFAYKNPRGASGLGGEGVFKGTSPLSLVDAPPDPKDQARLLALLTPDERALYESIQEIVTIQSGTCHLVREERDPGLDEEPPVLVRVHPTEQAEFHLNLYSTALKFPDYDPRDVEARSRLRCALDVNNSAAMTYLVTGHSDPQGCQFYLERRVKPLIFYYDFVDHVLEEGLPGISPGTRPVVTQYDFTKRRLCRVPPASTSRGKESQGSRRSPSPKSPVANSALYSQARVPWPDLLPDPQRLAGAILRVDPSSRYTGTVTVWAVSCEHKTAYVVTGNDPRVDPARLPERWYLDMVRKPLHVGCLVTSDALIFSGYAAQELFLLPRLRDSFLARVGAVAPGRYALRRVSETLLLIAPLRDSPGPDPTPAHEALTDVHHALVNQVVDAYLPAARQRALKREHELRRHGDFLAWYSQVHLLWGGANAGYLFPLVDPHPWEHFTFQPPADPVSFQQLQVHFGSPF